jgi:hypothetical protein
MMMSSVVITSSTAGPAPLPCRGITRDGTTTGRLLFGFATGGRVRVVTLLDCDRHLLDS